MTRWKASAIHLSLSILIISILAAVLIWRWYPPGLFQMAKADQLLFIIGVVDVVIGPLLTLIVYKHGKKNLKLDLALIALVQITAMAYGLNTLWQSRPVYLVATVDRFNLVFANQIDPVDQSRAAPQFQRLPLLSVETIAAVPPKDSKERMQALFSALAGKDIDLMPAYYAPYEAAAKEMLGHSMPASELATGLPAESSNAITAAMKSSGLPAAQLRVVPINSARGFATMLLDARDGRVVGPVAVDPWPVFAARGSAHPSGGMSR